MKIENSQVLIQFLLIFGQSGDVLFFLCAPRLRGYTATVCKKMVVVQLLTTAVLELSTSE